MDIIIFLIPVALLLGLLGVGAFFWALKNNQYDDLEGDSARILIDDDHPKR
jgi:cbb3-type cytochrome oxidase maturation protein